MTATLRLPAEWEPHGGVLMAWPHAAPLWKTYLPECRATIARIAAAITRYERLVLVTSAPGESEQALQAAGADMARVTSLSLPTNDIWARDFGPITVHEDGQPLLLDFQFTGWGGKYPCDLDNRITARLKDHGLFGSRHARALHFVLEGGAIDSDGQGALLTTRSCLANPNRNPACSTAEIQAALTRFLGVTRIFWLEHGYLAGDDTDGHVDMLARFAPNDTIVYTACDSPDDEHYPALTAMADELKALRTLAGQPYRLLPLPWPRPVYHAGERLPASYANFLVLNGAVLAPAYNDPSDAAALSVIGQAFPGRKIIGIDCSTLIRQHGALHCATMQIPRGVLA